MCKAFPFFFSPFFLACGFHTGCFWNCFNPCTLVSVNIIPSPCSDPRCFSCNFAIMSYWHQAQITRCLVLWGCIREAASDGIIREASSGPLVFRKHYPAGEKHWHFSMLTVSLLVYMGVCACLSVSNLPATQLVVDNYNSWLATSWKQQTPCPVCSCGTLKLQSALALTPSVHHIQPFYLLLSSTTLILSEQDVLPCFWQDLLQSHATKTQHSFQIQKVGFITAF